MTYATQADLESRFGAAEILQRADRDGNGTIDPGVIAGVLADADAEINGYLAARYPLPLAAVSPMLVRIACDIARYNLWADAAPEQVRQRYEDARRTLEGISSGRVSLGLPAASTPAPSLASAHGGSARVFGRDNTAGY